MSSSTSQQTVRSLRSAVLTVSNNLDEETDRPGSYLRSRLPKAGHKVVLYRILPEKTSTIQQAVEKLSGKVDLVVFNGAEPTAPLDGDAPQLSRHLERTIPGFGELYRLLAYEEIGPLSMLEQASAGLCGGTLFISLPGSLKAVRLGMEKLVFPELRELMQAVRSPRHA